jgi:carbonic anhydrase
MIFTPKQIHFHKGSGKTNSPNDDGSEHTFQSKYYPLEMHIVHMNNFDKDADKFIAAVVGILFDVDNSPGFTGSFADIFFEKLLTTNEEIDFQAGFVDHLNMIDRYVYTGSLTTPPYTENLLWNVIPTIVPIK